MNILVASTNKGKLREISKILDFPEITIISPEAAGIHLDVVEDGSTFDENATKKALAWFDAAKIPTLADDSGLCVEALGGDPGVRSARFAGEKASDEDNCRLLLERMAGITNRKAKFVCSMVLVTSPGKILTARGEYEGRILEEQQGSNGFGYDPLFFDPASKKTFAQLSAGEKNERSHRRRALENLVIKLREEGHIK